MLGGGCVFSTEQPFMKTFMKHLLQFEQSECRAVAGQSSYESSVWKYTGITCLWTRIGHSQVLSILKNLCSLSCSRAVCFMQPANTVELVLPVLWYFTLEYLSHSFPFHEIMNDAGKMRLNKAGSTSLYQWFQINAFSHCHSDSLVTEEDLAQWHFAHLCVSGCTKANCSQ